MPLMHWGLALAAFGPMFAAWPGVASPYSLPKLLALALATAAAAFGAFRSADGPGKAKAITEPSILRPLAALLSALALAALFSEDPAASLLGDYSQRAGWTAFALGAAAAALAQGAGAAFAKRALLIGAAAGAALSAIGLLQLAGLDPVLNAVGEISYGRVGSLVGSPVGLGCCLAMLMPLQLRLALDGEDARQRGAGWVFLAIAALGLAATWSRGAWLAAALGLSCYLYWTRRARGLKLLAITLFAAAALAFAAGRFRPTAGSDRGRVETWKSAWNVFKAHPILGSGPGTFDLMLGRHKTEGFVRAYGEAASQGQAHNDLLEALSSTGLAGFAAYVWLLVAAWRRLQGALRDDALRASSAAAGAGLVAVFAVAKFNPVPLDALALGAVLLGLLDPRGARPRELSTAAAALSAAAVLATSWLVAADRRCLQGMRAQHEGRLAEASALYGAAARLNPSEQRYGFWLVGALREQARAEKEPSRRLALGLQSVNAARAMERRHPGDVRALHALGGSLAALALQGGPDGMEEAAEVLERGARADWSYRPLLETRLTVANLRRDARAKADTTARLARLDALKR